MKSINLYLEYLLIFIISLSIINFVYYYYENNKTYLSALFLDREEETSLEIIDSYFKNILNFYNSSEFLNLNINGICKYNYAIFYKSSICYPNAINISYSEDLIIINDSFYLYSNLTNIYYLVSIKTSRSFKGCYENRMSYIMKADFCYGLCIRNCRINIRKNGNKIYVYLK